MNKQRKGGVEVRDVGGDTFRRNKTAHSLFRKAVKCHTIYHRNDFRSTCIPSRVSRWYLVRCSSTGLNLQKQIFYLFIFSYIIYPFSRVKESVGNWKWSQGVTDYRAQHDQLTGALYNNSGSSLRQQRFCFSECFSVELTINQTSFWRWTIIWPFWGTNQSLSNQRCDNMPMLYWGMRTAEGG